MSEPSLIRLYLLRACYLLLFVGLSMKFWPLLLGPITERAVLATVVAAMLSALAFCSFLGVLAPIRMLPVLLWEIVWKVTWSLSVALPKWRSGTLDAEVQETLFAVSFVIPFIFIFPWRYFFSSLASSLDRWR